MNKFYSLGKLLGGAINTLFMSKPNKDLSKNKSNSGSVTSPLHWPPTGTFPVAAVGESFYRTAITQIAKNESSDQALVFCTATLIPEDQNEHDPLAVAIWITSTKVGHLSRNDAQILRHCLASSGLQGLSTTCDAVIHGGGNHNGREYDYAIELDFQLGENFNKSDQVGPTYPRPVHLATAAAISLLSETDFELKVRFVDRDALEKCTIGCELKLWTRDDIDHIHFFAPKSIGGTGRVAVLAKNIAPELAKDLSRVSATIEQIEGRSCVIRCKLKAVGANGKRKR